MTSRQEELKPKASQRASRIVSATSVPPFRRLDAPPPFHATVRGASYAGDSERLLAGIPDASVDLIFTSPPYALHFQKEYGNVRKDEYVQWFLRFAPHFHRILKPEGSFVLNIGGSYEQGTPTRSLYHFKLLIALVEEVKFHLAQECFWFNPAKLPVPAEWVNVRRIRVRDSVEYVWWLSKSPWPKADNKRVLRNYSADMIRLNKRGVRPTRRPSGHNIRASFDQILAGGSIPPNVLEGEAPSAMLKFGNNAANDAYIKGCRANELKPHPARFPAALPSFFIRLLTEEGDLVLDPFAGSNTTGAVAESLKRDWLAFELREDYLEGSRFRFDPEIDRSSTDDLEGGELRLL